MSLHIGKSSVNAVHYWLIHTRNMDDQATEICTQLLSLLQGAMAQLYIYGSNYEQNSGLEENIKNLSQERFGRYAAGYVQSTDHANADELGYLVSLVQPEETWHMLDVATGGGHTALAFAPYVSSVIASDVTPQMLAQAESYINGQSISNVRYEIVDAMQMPFDAGTFDLVTCRIAAHHFSDAVLFVQEANRVLKPGGILLVQDQAMSRGCFGCALF